MVAIRRTRRTERKNITVPKTPPGKKPSLSKRLPEMEDYKLSLIAEGHGDPDIREGASKEIERRRLLNQTRLQVESDHNEIVRELKTD
jgi:hypothetical protein